MTHIADADAILVHLEEEAFERGRRRALEHVREIIGDDPALSPWLRLRTTLTGVDFSDPRLLLDGPIESTDEELVYLLMLATGSGREGLAIVSQMLGLIIPYMDQLVARLDQSLGRERIRRVVMFRNRAAKRLALARELEARGDKAQLALEARERRRRIDRDAAVPLLRHPLEAALAERRPADFRLLIMRARARWDTDRQSENVPLNPLRRLGEALDADQLTDESLEPAMRLLSALRVLSSKEPERFLVDVYAPHTLRPTVSEGLRVGRLTGERELLYSIRGTEAPYALVSLSDSALRWKTVARAVLRHPDLMGGAEGPRQVFVPASDPEVVEEVARSLDPLEPEPCIFTEAGGKISSGVRIIGCWEGVPVALHAVSSEGVVRRGRRVSANEARRFISSLVDSGRLDERYRHAGVLQHPREAVSIWDVGAPVARMLDLSGPLDTSCHHAASAWGWGRDMDRVLWCPACGITLAVVPLHQLPEARGIDGVAGVDLPEASDPQTAEEALKRAQLHAALAGEPEPSGWQELVDGSDPADLIGLRARVLAAALPPKASRRSGLQEAFARSR